MSKLKFWAIFGTFVLLLVGPPLILKPSIKYDTLEEVEGWGQIVFENSALGSYSSQNILHQVTIKVSPFAEKNTFCKATGLNFELSSDSSNTEWTKAIRKVENLKPIQYDPIPRLLFTGHANDSAIPVKISSNLAKTHRSVRNLISNI